MANYSVKANPEIRPLGPVTDADVEKIRSCFARELGVNETARELGLSTNQVNGAKKKHGLTSVQKHDNSAAVEAFASKARRQRHERREKWQKITEKLLDDLDRDLNPTGKTVVTLLRGMGGMESEEFVSQIPSRDLRERIAAVNLAETQIQKIDALEDDQGLSRGLSMLEKFSEAAAALMGGLPAPREGLIQE